ncbi:MAG: T9SS type A sorting domain-containing protein [Bacteroidetes bacterium]|nr:T9SS type A sorting domain-containing protein [Bacteroidota bacterium]
MRKPLLLFFLLFISRAEAQLNYTFSGLAGTYTALSGASTLHGSNQDDALSAATNIGFSFTFGGVSYTQFKASTNGWLTFNTALTASNSFNDLTFTVDRPIIAPLWDDLATNGSGAVSYKLSGTSPNQILTVEWKQMLWTYSAGTYAINFQVRLFETTNVIEFVYLRNGNQTANISASASASIGLAGQCDGDFYSLADNSASPAVSKLTETTSINKKPANNQVYRWTPAVLPLSGDLCASPIAITYGIGSCNASLGTVVGATSTGSPAAPACWSPSTSSNDVWYAVTKPAGQTTMQVSTDLSSSACNPFGTAIAVYSGTCGTPVLVGCADNNGIQNANNAILVLTGLPSAATSYLIRVEGDAATVGNFQICVRDVINDDCANATPLTPGVSCVTTAGNVSGATGSLPASACSGTANDDVWYSFVASQATHVITVVGSSSFDAVVQVLSGPCGSMTSLFCTDNSFAGGTESITATGLTAGTTYYVRVYDYDTGMPSTTSFTICVTTPVMPTCPTALGTGVVNVASLPYTSIGRTTCGKVNDLTASNVVVCGSSSYYTGEDEVFVFTPSSSGNITISLTSSGSWTGMMLYAACPFSGSCVGFAQSSVGNKSLCTTVASGVTYYLIIDSYASPACNPFDISITAPTTAVANDEPCSAIALPVATSCSYVAYTNECTSASSGVPAPGCANYLGADVWFTAVVPASGSISIDTKEGTVTDGGMAIYSGTCSSLTLISCDDNNSTNGLMPQLSQTGLSPGSTVWIRVWEYGNDNNGTFSICVSDPCPGGSVANDQPCNATALGLNVNLSGDNTCANGINDPLTLPSCWVSGSSNTVWYKIVCPASGQLKIRTSLGSLSNTQIALFSGACGALTLVTGACNDNSPSCGTSSYTNSELSISSGLTSGQTYYLAIDGTADLKGTFDVMAVDGSVGFPLAAGQDCGSYNPVCGQSISVGNPGYQAYGNACNFAGGGSNCLASGERGTAWYSIPINANGNLAFDIVPNDWLGAPSTTSTDYDFALWKISGSGATTCAAISGGAAPLRCNYDGYGVTGCFGNVTNTAPAAYPGFGLAYETQVSVVSGEVYVLVVSNFTNSTSGFTLNFSASAPINYTSAGTTITWSGGTNTAWALASNWGGCNPPNCTIDASVVPGSTSQPVISTNTSVKNLTINNGATLTINSGAILQICGDYVNNGNLLASPNSTILFNNGSVIQNIDGALVSADKFGNLSINKTGGQVNLLQNIDIGGNFTTSTATSILNTNGKSIKLAGNLSNFGGNNTFSGIGASGVLEFNGTSSQSYFQGNAVLDLNSVILNHSGTGVNLLSNLIVKSTSGSLTLNNGKIITGANEVVVANVSPASVNAGNSASFVSGNLRRYLSTTGAYNFPLGAASKGYQLANINFTSATSIGNLLGRFDAWPSTPPIVGGSDCSNFYSLAAEDNGYWTITADANPTSGTYTAALYPGSAGNIAAASAWTIMKAPNLAGVWGYDGTCGTGTSTLVSRTGMKGFSVFAAAQGISGSLPINLLGFDGKREGSQNHLFWTTASEINNAYFVVEKSENGIDFLAFQILNGAGNSNGLLHYLCVDEKPFDKISYYRLKQVDFDGAFSFSRIISIAGDSQLFQVIATYPNPTNNEIYLDLKSSAIQSTIKIRISDVFGRLLAQHNVIFSTETIHYALFLGDFPAGIYFVQLLDSNEIDLGHLTAIKK